MQQNEKYADSESSIRIEQCVVWCFARYHMIKSIGNDEIVVE